MTAFNLIITNKTKEIDVSYNTSFHFVLLAILLISLPFNSFAQPETDTIPVVKSELENPLFYDAEDSVDLDMINQKAYLYNKAHIEYGDFELKACFIEFDFKTQLVKAKLCVDSNGNKVGVPELSDGDMKTKADSLMFNFETKKGITYHVKMQEGEGYIHGSKIKRQASGDIHIDTALYTTCSLDHPHYYFKLRKAIIKPDDKIVSGPVNLFVADIPTPLGLPFAYFPNQKDGTNGIIIPTYGNSPALGFYLTNGGYYYKFKQNKKGKWSPLADKVAITLLGDIYSKGSWGLVNKIDYYNKYKFRGNLNLSYREVLNGERHFPSFTKNKEFFIRWTHNQDAKARPNTSFSAKVNYGTKKNFRNNYNNNIAVNDLLANNFNSNIAWSKRFNGKLKSNLNINLRHNQNNKNITFILPETSYNINRFYIGKLLSKPHTGKARWYEQIGTTYSVNFKNQTKALLDSSGRFDNEDLLKNMQYGAKHNIRAATSLRLFNKKVSLTPSYNFTLFNYFEQTKKRLNVANDSVITDTLNVFNAPFMHNLTVGMTSKIYGFYQFAKFLQGKRQSKIRHTLTPSVNFSYRPNNSYKYEYTSDTTGNTNFSNLYQTGIYGVPTSGESGRLGFSLTNALELKQKDIKNDSIDDAFKKMSILDNLTFSSGYDLLKDSFNLDVVRISGRTKLYKNLNTRFGASLDPYAYDTSLVDARTKYFQTDIDGKLGTIKNANLALSLNFKSKKGAKDKYKSNAGSQVELDEINKNKNAYVDFNIPWSLGLDYKINYTKLLRQGVDTFKITQTVGVQGDLRITEKWMVTYLTNYDISQKKFSYSSIDIRRDLHCWEMAFHWVPFGVYQSYSIQINVKSAMLQDLKLQRRRNWYDNGVN